MSFQIRQYYSITKQNILPLFSITLQLSSCYFLVFPVVAVVALAQENLVSTKQDSRTKRLTTYPTYEVGCQVTNFYSLKLKLKIVFLLYLIKF